MEFLNTSTFWIGLLEIVWINIILSGDNAVVIALAARSLPPEQQRKAVLIGSGAALSADHRWTAAAVDRPATAG
jgi:predicted tellurium resistance membrane protein TerC